MAKKVAKKTATKVAVKPTAKAASAKKTASKPSAAASPKAEPKKAGKPAPAKSVKAPSEEKAAPASLSKSGSKSASKPVDRSALSEDGKRWLELYEKHGATKAAPYDMKADFQAQTALSHKIFGWGWVVKSENNRLEVLFENGVLKSLICNYKG